LEILNYFQTLIFRQQIDVPEAARGADSQPPLLRLALGLLRKQCYITLCGARPATLMATLP